LTFTCARILNNRKYSVNNTTQCTLAGLYDQIKGLLPDIHSFKTDLKLSKEQLTNDTLSAAGQERHKRKHLCICSKALTINKKVWLI